MTTHYASRYRCVSGAAASLGSPSGVVGCCSGRWVRAVIAAAAASMAARATRPRAG